MTQHFPRTLDRQPGVDFRLPTDQELDAMEAFQLSLGRSDEIDLSSMSFRSPIVERGKEIFNTSNTADGVAGKCALCHENAGANNATGTNFNFNTGVEDLPDQPADLITEQVMDLNLAQNPPDNGFGLPGNPAEGTFNTPTLIEAADTGPFFHNHSIETIEEAVNFYNSDAFNNSPSGMFLQGTDGNGVGIELQATHVVAVAGLLRVLNALENIRSAETSAESALQLRRRKRSVALIKLAIVELEDAIQVLDGGNLHPEAQRLLRRSAMFLRLAVKKHFGPMQKKLLNQALDKMNLAREALIVS
ncbi:MAG: hypothetical protein GTO40_20285 [Deltaproteobacteria bacterium]|nr:hypothetical protein [Deltaproteobacteria bacterium]